MSAIYDNPSAQRYEWTVDGHLCLANYSQSGDRLSVTHVEVPPALRNRGLAAQLMAFVVADCKARGLTLIPICSYAAAYMRKHAS